MTKIHIVPVLRDNYCHIVEGDNKECLIVDPGQTGAVEETIARLGLKPALILNTHHHADHVAGNNYLADLYGVQVAGPKAESHLIPHMDIELIDGQTISRSGITLRVIATPGHTAGHIVFHDADNHNLFCGDTLFSMGCGRLMEGTPADMYTSLQKLKSLPAQTNIYCGHEYTAANGAFALHIYPGNTAIAARMAEVKKLRANLMPTLPVTLETELQTNPFLLADNLETFTAYRAQKDSF